MHPATNGHRLFRPAAASVGLAALAMFAAAPAQAHVGGTMGGFVSGFEHPLLGPDHLLAMFAVGVWGAQIGGRSIWELPVMFPLIMACGGMLGIAGFWGPEVTIVQIGIGLSVLGLGLAIAAIWTPIEIVSVLAVSIFALFHGYAHGVELPKAADPVAYGVGFVTATGLIHCAGIGFGLLLGARNLHGLIGRSAGALIAVAGVWFLYSPP
jgi:urease accessory protein